jgi:hypothetical protein
LELAIEIARQSDRASRQQIDSMLKDRPWREGRRVRGLRLPVQALHLRCMTAGLHPPFVHLVVAAMFPL